MMKVPEVFLTQSRLFREIMEMAESEPNNMTLGESVRTLVGEYKEGKYATPSTMQLDNKEKK